MRGAKQPNLSGKADSEGTRHWVQWAGSTPSETAVIIENLSEGALHHTPLHALHLELGASMVPFAGYDMPVNYPAGLMAEHKHMPQLGGAVRRLAHGAAAPGRRRCRRALESLVPADVDRPGRGQAALRLAAPIEPAASSTT